MDSSQTHLTLLLSSDNSNVYLTIPLKLVIRTFYSFNIIVLTLIMSLESDVKIDHVIEIFIFALHSPSVRVPRRDCCYGNRRALFRDVLEIQ
jgi:hypothetical protein